MGVSSAIDLTAGQRRTVLALLNRHLPNTTVWAYGSRVQWTSHPASDLDLVAFTKPEQSPRVAELREAFDESNLPFRVDLFVWDDVPESFKKRIEDGHVVLTNAKKLHNTKGGWADSRWGDLATLEYGKALRNYRNSRGSHPVFGTNGQIGYHSDSLSYGPTVIVGRKGAYRGVHYSPKPCWVIDTAFHLKPQKDIDTRWAYYELLNQDINKLDSGSAIPSTSREEFYALPVTVPPIQEQRAIAQVLGTLDDKIELNRRMGETLEGAISALFKSWFVDFDPVRTSGFQTSSCRHIPFGWEIKPVGGACAVLGGSTPSTKVDDYWQGGSHCWATPKDLARLSTSVLINTARKITDAGLRQISSGLLPKGTVLMSSRAPIGYLAISDVPVSVNQGFIAMVPNRSMSSLYLLNWCRFHQREILSIANGSTFLEVAKRNFRQLDVVVPTAQVMAAFERFSGPVYRRVVLGVRESLKLADLRDTLLPKLLSGEIRIQDAERIAETAT